MGLRAIIDGMRSRTVTTGMFRGALLAAAAVTALAGGAGAGIDYSVTYLAVPAETVWVERQANSNAWASAAPSWEPFNERVRFGSLGFRLGAGLPARLGPFVAGAEMGFSLPAGSQTFDHAQLFKAGPGVTAFNKNDTHEGDITTWDVTTVPLLFRLRYSPPQDRISLGGQLAVGPVLVARNTEYTEVTYSAVSGQVVSRETRRTQDLVLPMGVELTGGLIVPMSESLALQVLGGVLWVSEVRETTTDNFSHPILIRGPRKAGSPESYEPAVKMGGLGYAVRIGFTLTR